MIKLDVDNDGVICCAGTRLGVLGEVADELKEEDCTSFEYGAKMKKYCERLVGVDDYGHHWVSFYASGYAVTGAEAYPYYCLVFHWKPEVELEGYIQKSSKEAAAWKKEAPTRLPGETRKEAAQRILKEKYGEEAK